MNDLKAINIGHLIALKVKQSGMDPLRICNFLKVTEEDLSQMYMQRHISTDLLLKWSKLLEYDFFRLYSQHLILYAPPSSRSKVNTNNKSTLPKFRKNLYTKEIIDFVLEQLISGNMSKNEVAKRYNIPKSTLYKWIVKYKNPI